MARYGPELFTIMVPGAKPSPAVTSHGKRQGGEPGGFHDRGQKRSNTAGFWP
jgi:hypothetical protein